MQVGHGANACQGLVWIMMLSEIEITSLTIKLAGISGKTRLDKESLQCGEVFLLCAHPAPER